MSHSHRSSNPFDDDDELQNEYDDVGSARSEPVYVPLGDAASLEANSAARNQMRQYVSKNRLKFQKHFQRASSHLDSEGLDNEVLDCRDETPERIAKFLWSERVYGYPYSGGTVLGNYRRYVMYNHPLLSICFVHHLHPFGRMKRIVVYLCLLCYTLVISYVLLVTTLWPAIALCREGCQRQNVTHSDGSKADECVGGYNNGLSYSTYRDNCQYYQPWMLSALSGAIAVPIGSIMKYLATCGCIHGKRFFRTSRIGRSIQSFTNFFGWITLGLFSLAGVTGLLWTIIQCWQNGIGYEIFITLLLSKIWSFGEWFLYTAPYFAYLYPIDKKYFYERLRARAAAASNSLSSSTLASSASLA